MGSEYSRLKNRYFMGKSILYGENKISIYIAVSIKLLSPNNKYICPEGVKQYIAVGTVRMSIEQFQALIIA